MTGVEVDGAARRAGLAGGVVELVGHRDERPGDGESPRVQVDVAPAQAEELASSHAGGGGQPVGGKSRCDLAAPRTPAVAGHSRPEVGSVGAFRRLGVVGDVVDDQPRRRASASALRMTTCTSRTVLSLRPPCPSLRPRGAAPSRGFRGGRASNVAEAGSAKPRNHVELDEAAGSRSQVLGRRLTRFAGSPPAEQEGRHRQARLRRSGRPALPCGRPSRSPRSWSVPAGCQRRRSRPVMGSTPSYR